MIWYKQNNFNGRSWIIAPRESKSTGVKSEWTVPRYYNDRQLKEIDTLLPILANFSFLEALDISENNIKSLSSDLSCLGNLHILNINNNPFEDFNKLVQSLQTLPGLKSLNLNLEQNEEVELILTSLTNLEILNDQGIW